MLLSITAAFLMDQKARFKYLIGYPLPEDVDVNAKITLENSESKYTSSLDCPRKHNFR
jgi:hypothetical protein